MRSTDRSELAKILQQTYSVFGKELTADAVKLWYGVLEPYDLPSVRLALSEVLRASKYLPKPADVVDFLDPPDWPSPTEAWGLHPKDECETGAVCEATGAAWEAAEDLWYAGDRIAARKAFEGAYSRHRDEALRNGQRRPDWRLSLGWDLGQRRMGALTAVRAGFLTPEQTGGLIHDQSERPTLSGQGRRGQEELRHIRGFLKGADEHGTDRGVREGARGMEAGEKT